LFSTGKLAMIPSLLILYFGDFISDIFFFSVGNGSKKIIMKLNPVETTPASISKIDDEFTEKPWKTMIIGKAAYGIGITFMTAAGASRMTFPNFIKYISILNAFRTVILFTFGFYFGKTIFHFGPEYYPAYIAILLGFVAFWLYLTTSIKKKTGDREEKKG
jgi:membrane protein DedA with SNARE-associated domain